MPKVASHVFIWEEYTRLLKARLLVRILRWFWRLFLVGGLAALVYYVAFIDAPDLSAQASDLLSARTGGLGSQPVVRILVGDNLEHASLTINGQVKLAVTSMNMKQSESSFRHSVTVDILPTGNGVKVGKDQYVRVNKLVPLDGGSLRLAWTSAKNKVELALPYEIEIYGTHIQEKGQKVPRLRIVAHVPMEEYLYGVVPAEMQPSWPLEALRAQAVASRTYALFEVKSRAKAEYDVTSTVSSQVWRPAAAVEPQVKRAVDSTAGVVLTERNALLKTFFHSECGGFTADARWVFTKTPITALSGVRCPRCSVKANNPTPWSSTYSRADVAKRLKSYGLIRGGEIRSIQALDSAGYPLTGPAVGRAVTMDVTLAGGSGTTVRIPAAEFRLALGAKRDEMASTYMFLEGGDQPKITMRGLGWGHGVGMCQHGARYCADKLRYNFLDILALYYPGSKPVRLWGSGQPPRR